MEDKDKLEGERLRRKIAATILTGIYNQTPERQQKMGELIFAPDVKIKTEQYESLIDMMAKGQVGRDQGKEIILMVQKPVDQYGVSEIFARLNAVNSLRGGATKVTRLKRILGNFSDTGFDRYLDTNASSVATFFSRFPDAMSFDVEADRFLRSVNNPQNPPEVVGEYYEAMTDFKDIMFGEEQKYLDQYKVMEQQAARRRDELERQRGELVSTSAVRQITKVAIKKADGETRKEDVVELAEGGEDTYTSMPDDGVFGVFDGAGGEGNGQEAARAAKEAFEKQKPERSQSAEELAKMMEKMNEAVLNTGGMSTAILAKVNRDEQRREYLSFASVGDSRLYILHKNGMIDQMTTDEGEENMVWNILGLGNKERHEVRENMGLNTEATCLQYGDIWLVDGDRVILCSDGISGDRMDDPEKKKPGDMLTPSEIRDLASTRTTEQAADALMLAAKKIDDRTVIVFDA